MKLYEAINTMRQMSADNQEFAFSFMSYSLSRDKSEGEVSVEHAILYKNPKEKKQNAYQDYMLTYLDTDTHQAHHFWQPLLMSFQHQPLEGIE